jgi:hypothetical protein
MGILYRSFPLAFDIAAMGVLLLANLPRTCGRTRYFSAYRIEPE